MRTRSFLKATACGFSLLAASYSASPIFPALPNSNAASPAAAAPAQCAVVPAAANPPGGGGTPNQIQIDPGVYGRGNLSQSTVYGFSQALLLTNPLDPEIAETLPDVVPRAWNRWDRDGLQTSDFNFNQPAQAHAQGTLFIGATTASVLFADEPVFSQTATCNAAGNLVVHSLNSTTNYYRASLASPAYQDYLVQIGEVQIDGGVDGLFFDETTGSYSGATYDGNEGFDDANVADFGGYLCAKYPALTPSQWTSKFGITTADNLNCSLSAEQRGRGFNYRGYLLRLGFQNSPMNSKNPLAAEWGFGSSNRVDFSAGNFTTAYVNLVYWQNIVLRLRNYARQKYGKEIFIIANGIFPFVDIQMPNLYEYNTDAPDGSTVNYLPLTSDGHFDGTKSWLPVFQNFQRISANLSGFLGLRSRTQANAPTPMTMFIDWPGQLMTNYYNLQLRDRQDYMRMLMGESYSSGILFSLPLMTSLWGDPSADQLGMIPIFRQLRDFYKGHEALYHNTTSALRQATVSAPNLMQNLVTLPDGSFVLHLVNHNYTGGFTPQNSVSVSFAMPQAPARVTLASPDVTADQSVAFTYSNGQVQLQIPQIVSYTAVLASPVTRKPKHAKTQGPAAAPDVIRRAQPGVASAAQRP